MKAINTILLILILAVVAYVAFFPTWRRGLAPQPDPLEVGKWYDLSFEWGKGGMIYKIVERGPGNWCRVQPFNNGQATLTYWINVDRAISIHERPLSVMPSSQ
jgi:hypothetical protein